MPVVKKNSSISKEMLEGLRRSVENITASEDYIYVKDCEGKFVLINKAGAEQLGKPINQIIGKTIQELFPGNYSNVLHKQSSEVIKTGKVQINELDKNIHGEKRAYLDIKIPLFDHKNIIGVWGLTRPLSEDKFLKKQEKLLEGEQKARQEAEQSRDSLYRLQYVTNAFAQALIPSQIAEIIVTLGVATFKAFSGAVWLFDQEHILRLAAYTGYTKEAIEQIPYVRKRGNTPTTDAIKRKKPVILHSKEERITLYPETMSLFKNHKTEAFIAIPLLLGQKVLGAINFSFEYKKQFTVEEQEFIYTLTQQFVQALDRARLYEEEKTQKERLEESVSLISKLQTVTAALSKSLTIQDVFEVILTTAIDTTGACKGRLCLISETDKNTIEVAEFRTYQKEVPTSWKREPLLEGVPASYAIRKKKAVFIGSKDEYRKIFSKNSSTSSDSQAFAVLPLIVERRVIGSINLSFAQEKRFDQQEREFLLTLADQCAQALDRVKIYQQEKLQRMKAEKAVQSLLGMQKIIIALAQVTTQKEIATIILNEGIDTMRAHAGDILLLDQEKRVLLPIASKGYKKAYLQSAYSLDKPYLAAEVFMQGKPLFVDEIHALPRKYKPAITFAEKTGYKAAALLPFKIENKTIGLLDLSFKEKNAFTDDEKQFMLTLVHQCSQALDRVHAYEAEKGAVEELEKREARFRSLIEKSSEAVALLDAKGKIIYMSQSSEKIIGVPAQDRIGNSIFEFIYPEDKLLVQKTFASLLRHGGTTKSLECRIINANGEVRWMETLGTNLLQDPNVGAIVVNYRDVTDRIQAEQDLRRSKEELEVILRNVGDAVTVRDATGKLIFVNYAALQINRQENEYNILNTPYEQYLDRLFTETTDDLGNPLTQEDMPTYRVLHGEKYVHQILRVVLKNGEEQWRNISVAGLYDENNKLQLVINVMQDITEMKQKEKLKDEFISTASHELKTPITSAKLFAGILQNRLQELGDEKAYSVLAKIDTQLDRLTKLISDLLDVTKIRSGKLHFAKEKVSIDELVFEVVDEMQYTTVTHKLILQGSTKKSVFIDSERIRQVLINLLNNAIKYSPKAKKVDVLLFVKSNNVVICIKDYGIGISKENKEKLFEPFFRGSNSEKRDRFPGLGLGLHIASELVKRHNGEITVESNKGKGTTFCVILPVIDEKGTTR